MQNKDLDEPTPDNFFIDEDGDDFVFEDLCSSNEKIFNQLINDLNIVNKYDAYFYRPSQDNRPLPECWKRFLQQLKGSYRSTLIKMYRIRNNLDVS